jgi:replicative DNA helicase
MVDLADLARPIDIITLIEELGRKGELERVGGEGYVSDLISGLPDRPLSDLDDYVKQVQIDWRRREVSNRLKNAQSLVDDLKVSSATLGKIGKDLIEFAEEVDRRPSNFSEEGLALQFSRTYAADWR